MDLFRKLVYLGPIDRIRSLCLLLSFDIAKTSRYDVYIIRFTFEIWLKASLKAHLVNSDCTLLHASFGTKTNKMKHENMSRTRYPVHSVSEWVIFCNRSIIIRSKCSPAWSVKGANEMHHPVRFMRTHISTSAQCNCTCVARNILDLINLSFYADFLIHLIFEVFVDFFLFLHWKIKW